MATQSLCPRSRVSEVPKKLKIAQKLKFVLIEDIGFARNLRLEKARRTKHILSGWQPRICERGATHYKRKDRRKLLYDTAAENAIV